MRTKTPNLVSRGIAKRRLFSRKLVRVKQGKGNKRQPTLEQLTKLIDAEVAKADKMLEWSSQNRALVAKNTGLAKTRQAIGAKKATVKNALREAGAIRARVPAALKGAAPSTTAQRRQDSARLRQLTVEIPRTVLQLKTLNERQNSLIQQLRQGSAQNRQRRKEIGF